MTEYVSTRIALFRHGERLPQDTVAEDGWVVDVVVDIGIPGQLYIYRGRIVRPNPEAVATIEVIPDAPPGRPNPELAADDYVAVTGEQTEELLREWQGDDDGE